MARHRRHQHGESWTIVAALLDGPKTVEELKEQVRVMMRRIGVFSDPFVFRPRDGYGIDQFLSDTLTGLERDGWIVREDDRYRVTDIGRSNAETAFADLEKSGHVLDALTSPKRVSFVTLLVHFVLAALKLPAAIISGSVALLNDALDTLADGISSLIVHIGFKVNRERLSAIVLVAFMLITGGYTTYEAISGIVHPAPTTSDPFAYIAIIVSGLVCGVLWFYQKASGLRNTSMTLIAQSVDSRNHVFVAVGVVAGLIANVCCFPLVDRIVGLAIALLILKSAVELAVELFRSPESTSEQVARFGFAGLLSLVSVANGLLEERGLAERFGDEYEAYVDAVPRRFFSPAGWIAAVGFPCLLVALDLITA